MATTSALTVRLQSGVGVGVAVWAPAEPAAAQKSARAAAAWNHVDRPRCLSFFIGFIFSYSSADNGKALGEDSRAPGGTNVPPLPDDSVARGAGPRGRARLTRLPRRPCEVQRADLGFISRMLLPCSVGGLKPSAD